MQDTEQPDTRLRDRLRRAADAELPEPLGEQARAVLVQRLQLEQSRLRRRRLLWRSGIALAAAGVLAFLALPGSNDQASAPALCSLPTQVQIRDDGLGRPRIELGRFGELAGSQDAVLRVESAAPCALRLQLSQGTLAGSLANLRPGQLQIVTAHGEVVVRGTRFSVSTGDELRVVLLSGKVELVEGTQPALVLAPNQVLRRTRSARTIAAVAHEDSERIDALLSRVVARKPLATTPPPDMTSEIPDSAAAAGIGVRQASRSSAALLAQAELARRAGELAQARKLYGAASLASDANAEVALLRWVRLELGEHELKRAEQLLVRHRRRFGAGELRAEAGWLQIEVLRARGERARMRQSASELLERYPNTPQADAARALLREP